MSRARQQAEAANLGTVDAKNRYVWNDFNALKQAQGGFVSTGRSPIFHYAVAAHNLNPGSTSSGIAPFNGNDLIVSLGSFTGQVGSVNEQAGTLMHELG